ncbi:formate dehydrogenase subunit alpha [Vulcanibacillus modesticaldus]|uniref:Formate dehydrogenase subunit alpha n=1 Tax=Vulcanibacillus modesticaldus TaxID=337097 RepID=A0A1D2YWV5_9BACI|nr:formate dehydrogenase subunit alpha [Vulcanibacillus modesticaldus]
MAGLAASFGSGAMTNSFKDIENTSLIFLIGSNPTEAHPVLALKMRKAIRNGAKLIVADPRRTEMADIADIWLPLIPGTDIPLLNGLMHIIIKEELWDKEFVKSKTENFEELIATVENYPPSEVAKITGVNEELLYQAARLYANTYEASICYTLGITEHVTGTNNVINIANLAMLTGHLGRKNVGVNPLRGQNNVQGACDMGSLPDVFPGYQKVFNKEARQKFSKAWGVELSDKVGLTIPEMFDDAVNGIIRGMYIMGEDPVLSDPDSNHVRKALENLDFLVVQDIFMNETARLADVILPASSFAEKDGTFTNSERRVQRVRKAIDPIGNSKPDWQIICELSSRMGYEMHYQSASEIFDEMASLTHIYAGMDYQRLDKNGLHWPCPTKDHPGTEVLHVGKFTKGKGVFIGIDHIPPAELPDEEYPYYLSTGRRFYHYNLTTQYSSSLSEYHPEELAMVNPKDAKRLGIKKGDKIKITSRRGEVITSFEITDRVTEGTIWMSFHYRDVPTNVLTNGVYDPVSHTGEYKVAAVKVEKI